MTNQERKNLIRVEFQKRFGEIPNLWSRAPGRVDLMGSHTDYNLGYVMTMSIDRETWVAARSRSDRRVNIFSLNIPGSAGFHLDDLHKDTQAPWTNYVRGMAWALQHAGYNLTGFDGLVHSTVPFGSGLSSSAALEMAVGVMFDLTSGLQIEPVQMALLGQKAENEFVGMNCGILDQYSSVMGREASAVLLDCRSLTHTITSIAPNLHVVICDTRAPRQLLGSEYGERRAQCEEGLRILKRFDVRIKSLRDVTEVMLKKQQSDLPEVVYKRCLFIVQENQRVLDLAGVLPGGDKEAIRTLFDESYVGARDLYEVGTSSMEAMYRAMLNAPGLVGGRQAGAGFGGCMVALVKKGIVQEFTAHIEQDYLARTGIQPAVYPVRAAAGAGRLI